ncbi:hypothetical protein [Pseudodesulfovibrio pelocollis]|uniref:hypothetical protein n=1 Tax=Pseudodesulfovibrio pelocollis TaxID=3051432 RepID=UPI00255A910E|nr:hypothetical protein [Pseudodesulfovibrio sp. SB368]
MSKDFTDARHAACRAVATDPDIIAWMADHFPGQPLTVRREMPPGFLPGEDDLPCVGWGVSTHSRSDKDMHQIDHVCPLGIYLSMQGAEAVADEYGVECIEAVAMLDELGGLVEAAVSRALLAGGWPFDQDPHMPDDVDWSQFFMSFRLYRVREQSVI